MSNLYLNLGSGQRPFSKPWINVDCSEKHDPDWLCDIGKLNLEPNTVDIICLHHVLEHFHLGELNLSRLYTILKPGGSLLIFIPDIKALAKRWLLGQIDDYIFFVNVYGAYQGEAGDDHHFGYTYEGLREILDQEGFTTIKKYNWREIEGADIARDWWILGVEAIK